MAFQKILWNLYDSFKITSLSQLVLHSLLHIMFHRLFFFFKGYKFLECIFMFVIFRKKISTDLTIWIRSDMNALTFHHSVSTNKTALLLFFHLHFHLQKVCWKWLLILCRKIQIAKTVISFLVNWWIRSEILPPLSKKAYKLKLMIFVSKSHCAKNWWQQALKSLKQEE